MTKLSANFLQLVVISSLKEVQCLMPEDQIPEAGALRASDLCPPPQKNLTQAFAADFNVVRMNADGILKAGSTTENEAVWV